MNMNYLIFGAIGVMLIFAVVVVLLEAAYDSGFEDGFARGRAATRKEVR